MKPLQLNPRQHQLALQCETIEALIPITPSPERLHESNTLDGTWRWEPTSHYFDDLTLYDHLERHSPFELNETIYALEPWVLTSWGEDGVSIAYLRAPSETRHNLETPEFGPSGFTLEDLWITATHDMETAGYQDHGDGLIGDWRDQNNNPATKEDIRAAMRRWHEQSLPEWAARLKLRITNIKAEPLTLTNPKSEEGQWAPQPWVWRITLEPIPEVTTE